MDEQGASLHNTAGSELTGFQILVESVVPQRSLGSRSFTLANVRGLYAIYTRTGTLLVPLPQRGR